MNTFKILQVAAIALLVSSAATAATDDQNQDSSNMPMMEQNKDGMMMSPGMQHGMMNPEQYHNMPMMTPQMMHMMMHSMHSMGGYGQGHCQQQGMPMMGGGMGENMMNPQMMQMRMQHMTNMAKRLENIEALLSQLVELQQNN